MGFLDEVAAEVKHRGGVCTVRRILAGDLPEDVRADLRTAIDDPNTSAGAIERALDRKWQVTLSEGIIQRHRRGQCACRRRT